MTRDEQEKRDRENAEIERKFRNPAGDHKYGGVCPCPKCGMMTYASQEHKCPATKIKGAHPLKFDFPPGTTVYMDTGTPPSKMRSAGLRVPEIKPNPVQEADAAALAATALKTNPLPEQPEKDRSLIWDDCPACAFKHLTAAYAALTSLGAGACWVPAWMVYHARAMIAIRESETGYPGNKALAQGCLAMAELECEHADTAFAFRDTRMALIEGRSALPELHPPSYEAYAAAHITEALRELPALADRIHVAGLVSGLFFNYDNPSEVLDVLRTNIKWLAETYELNKGTNA